MEVINNYQQAVEDKSLDGKQIQLQAVNIYIDQLKVSKKDEAVIRMTTLSTGFVRSCYGVVLRKLDR